MFWVYVLALAGLASAAPPCADLTTLALPHATVTSSAMAAAGEFGTLENFCRIAATLKPTEDSEIRIEVWLPAESWNGNLQSVGNGAWGGVFSYSAMSTALNAGYATASTDGGHQGNTASFIAGHPEKVIDFGYRAVHEMTLAAKSIVNTHYGTSPKYSYFNGCSTGGRQAMAELQRYPDDYDGISAGDPVYDSSRIQGTQLWLWQLFHSSDASNIPRDKLALLHEAVIKSCDALDRVKDGVLEDPTRCGFEPSMLLCREGDAPNCLTAAQVEAARQSYIGTEFYPAREWGSELGWLNHSGKEPSAYAVELYSNLVFGDTKWDYRAFNLEKDLPRAQAALKDTMDFTDPNIGAFFAHGGKLLQYHGWNDPGVAPQGSINYYRAVAQALGGVAAIDKSYRLFMVPGMGHCGGGDGTSTFNMIDALEQWVEQDRAPDWIPASRVVDDKTVRTRPLCPYPQVAAYRGQGSTDEAPNFDCRVL